MKLLRSPRHRLLQELTTARQRAGLTPPQLAEQVSARGGFVEKYERGGNGREKAPSRRR